MELKTKNQTQNRETERKKTLFATKALLTGAAVVAAVKLAGCVPEVTNNINVFIPDGGKDASADTDCTTITECTTKTALLREPGNSAGPSEMTIGDAKLSIVAVVDSGATKAASVQMDGCEQVASATLVAGQTSTLGLGNDAFEVTNEEISYDASGVLVKVTVKPICPVDTDTSDAGLSIKDSSADTGGDAAE